MKKVDSTIIKETVYILAFTLIFSVLMQAVFLIIGKWNYTILLGNLLGGLAAVGNFFLMGLSVQSALGKDEKDAKSTMKVSQMLRTLLLFIVAVVGHVAPCFNLLAVVIPYIFPRIAIALRPLFEKK
ncbi:MAG: ATP synthase subunit I [Clostridia bacterium]|nr:ATP synthase subunit I [Clostridia bacterium]MBQ3128860.1 ATP synthase subunit I [Clostridia bacterium]MBQ7044779.1 ATP synthase subunit I [Clostridia bacterium]